MQYGRPMQNKIHILSTAPLPAALQREAAAEGVGIDIIPFTRIESLKHEEIGEQLMDVASGEDGKVVVFTSGNAVEAVAALVRDMKPRWKIFCTEPVTLALVKQHFGGNSIIGGSAKNAAALAQAIIDKKSVNEVTFFCGDHRRPELPEALAAANISVKEIVVYRSVAEPHSIHRHYQGILFFSPMAAESYFSSNTVDGSTHLFAIGETTADTIKKFTNQGIVTGIIPTKEELTKQAVAYFKAIHAGR